jgi:hypothetical protein
MEDRQFIVPMFHSVLRIDTKTSKYVLDPSAEQYGIPRCHRFLRWTTYKKRYLWRSEAWAGRARWTSDTAAHKKSIEQQLDKGWKHIREAVSSVVSDWLKEMRKAYEPPFSAFDVAAVKYEDKVRALRARMKHRLDQSE